jgi:glycosyltransferase involved in cell wall biosynthesis
VNIRKWRRRVLGALLAVAEPALLALLWPANRWRARRAPEPSRRVVFLVQHAYGQGGTIRTVLNCAGSLADRYDVAVVGLVRTRRTPAFPLPDGVAVSCLDDRVEPPSGLVRKLLARLPSVLVPRGEASRKHCSLWTDLLLLRFLRSLRGGVLITTRPSLNLAAAAFAPPGVRTIGQEHMNLGRHRAAVRARIARRYARLDTVVTLTPTDLASYERELPQVKDLRCIPNAVPPLDGPPADPHAKVVVAAGRLVPQKGFDLLLAAWERAADRRPGWELRVFGAGRLENELRADIEARGLTGSAFLMGRTAAMGAELARASVYALSSRFEGMPLVLIEAMSKGLAVVAFDCPTGPREVMTDDADGLLVPAEDVAAFASALGRLMDDADLRIRLGSRAVETVTRYAPEIVADQWAALLDGQPRPSS